MIFVAMPIVIPLVANLVLGIVTLVLSVALFDQNWPGIWHCRHYTQDPNRGWRRTSPSSYCTRKLHDVQVMTGIAGGLSLATG